MKVKLLVGRAGSGVSQKPGQIIEVSAREGKALIEGKAAVPVKSSRVEKAVINEAQTDSKTGK